MYDMITTPDMMTSVDSIDFSPMPFSNPYGDIDLMDIPAAPQPWLGNPYMEYDYMPLYPDTSTMMFANPYEEGLMNQIDIMTQDVMAPNAMMYANPFGDPEIAHALGLISDQDYAFLEMISPNHHGGSEEPFHTEPEPSMAQQKLDKSDFIERERDIAVDKYNDAKSAEDYEEMLKWETIANDKQQDLYNLWDTTQYGLPAKAPGID